MIHRDITSGQLDPTHSDSDSAKIDRVARLGTAFDTYIDGLDDEESQALSSQLAADEELNSIQVIAMTRAAVLFEELPLHEHEFTTGVTMSLPTNPVHFLWQAEKYRKSIEDAYEQPNRDASDTDRLTLATALTTLRDQVLTHVISKSVLEPPDPNEYREQHSRLKEGKSLGIAAKKRVKEIFDEKADSLEGMDFETSVSTLIEIYFYTLLAGKKVLYQQVADRLETIRRKNISKLVERELPNLNEVIMLALCSERTPEQQLKLETIVRERPMTATIAMHDMFFLHMCAVFRAVAQHDNELQLQEKMTLFVNTALSDKIETPDEQLRIMKRAYEIAGLKMDDESAKTQEALDFRPMELDWEVLPPGTDELEKTARQIVSDATAGTHKSLEVDLRRLVILEEIRKIWGEDASYYSRGVRNKRRTVIDSDGSEQPDEYIILVLQEIDRLTGEVMYEHAVAESPIAGPNALYVYRQDATDHRHSWRTVMSLPKNQSQKLGARDIRHTVPRGASSLNDVMVGKVEQILLASPTDFHDLDFNGIDKEGQVKVRRVLGRSAAFLTQQTIR